jgi:hypothetical protein
MGHALSDDWNGTGRGDVDSAAVLADVGNGFTGGIIPDGTDLRPKMDSAETQLGVPQNTNAPEGGNLGNKIGTVAGGLVGSVAGPLGLAEGANYGSRLGGWLGSL